MIHAAADVRHYVRGTAFDEPEGTGICFPGEKADALFIHISTVSVAGEFLKKAPELSAAF
ncbi:MAG: hypothetical protein ACLRMZ_21860 [Blautia marasmi]